MKALFLNIAVISLICSSRAAIPDPLSLNPWSWHRPHGLFVSGLQAVTAFGGDEILVGTSGKIFRLRGGETVRPFTEETVQGVASGNSELIAVGDNGLIWTSQSGEVWNPVPRATTNRLETAAFGKGTWIVAGDSNTILWSSNKIEWTAAIIPPEALPFNGRRLLYSLNRFLLFGATSTNALILTSEDGTHWEHLVIPRVAGLNDAVTGTNGIVAVGKSGSILFSTDAVTWTDYSVAGGQDWIAAAWGDGNFVALSPEGDGLVSTNGTLWTPLGDDLMTLNNGFARFGDLVYDEETRRFHAFLENGATRRDFDLPMLGTGVLTAEGGRNFAMVEAPDGRIFVGAQFGEFNWRIRGTQIIFPESFSMNRLESDVLVHGAGSYHFWSKNWALEDGPDFVSEKIVQSGGGFVAITPGGEIYHSTDLHDWERVLSVTGGTFSALVLNDGVFVAAGRDESENASIGKGFIYTSVDGREWTRSFSSDTYQVRDVASGRGRFLAVAHDATNAISLVSSNGMVWHPGSVLPDTSFDHVDFGDGIFVAAGFSGRPRVYGSHDGLHWVELQCSIDEPITEVAFAGSVFNLLGPWNTIVRSSPVRDLLTVLLTNLAGKKSVSLGVELIGTSAEIQVSPNLRDWTTWSTPANYLGKALLSEAPTNLARFFRVAY